MGTITGTQHGYTFQENIVGLGLTRIMRPGSEATGVDYNVRMYDAALGRFIQPDTIVAELGSTQGMNRYAYVMNNPVNFNDPTGNRVSTGCGPNGDSACAENPQEITDYQYFVQRNETLQCQAGNDLHCSYAEQHPVEVAAFGVTSLVGAATVESYLLGGGVGAAIDSISWKAGTACLKSGFCKLMFGLPGGANWVYQQIAKLFTKNAESTNVSLGSYAPNGYMAVGENNNMTYLDAPNWAYSALDKMGIWTKVNQGFIENQIEKGSTFFVTRLGREFGVGTLNEIEQIMSSGVYNMFQSNFSPFNLIFSRN